MKANTPEIPKWVYHRDSFSKYMVLGDKNQPINRMEVEKKTLSNEQPNVQEMLLVEDILDVMLGF